MNEHVAANCALFWVYGGRQWAYNALYILLKIVDSKSNRRALGKIVARIEKTSLVIKPLFNSQNIFQNILDSRHIKSLDICIKH
jgi:hypothetical protein